MTNTSNRQSSATSAINKPILKRGSRGELVTELQRLLSHWNLYPQNNQDGIFDADVEVAVKAFQHRVFLVEDGVVGNKTWQALFSGAPVGMPVLRNGSQGQSVLIVQRILSTTGDYRSALDGDFGPRTEAAVKAFQKRSKLTADGVVGDRTWHALSKIPH